MSKNKLKDMSSFERVWERQDEAKKIFIDHETFAEVERLDIKLLRKIAKEEGTTFEDFIIYAQARSLQEYSDGKNNEFNKIINAKKQDIHCDILGFHHEIVEPQESIIGFNDIILQHISENVADLDKFIENFVKNNSEYKDYHLETHYDKLQPLDYEYIPDVITSKIVTEFVRNDKNDN